MIFLGRLTTLIAAIVAISAAASAVQVSAKYQTVSDALVNQGQAALSNDEAARAQTLFERALTADPANVDALIGLGLSHEAQGRTGRGLRHYRHALELEPNNQRALTVQAAAFLKRDLPERAESNRERLSRLCPEGCVALTNVETALRAYRRTQAAVAAND